MGSYRSQHNHEASGRGSRTSDGIVVPTMPGFSGSEMYSFLWHQFGQIQVQFTQIHVLLEKIQCKQDHTTDRIGELDTRLTGRIDELDARLTGRIDKLDNDFGVLNAEFGVLKRQFSRFLWIGTGIGLSVGGLIGWGRPLVKHLANVALFIL